MLPDAHAVGRDAQRFRDEPRTLAADDLCVMHPPQLLWVTGKRKQIVTRGDGTVGNLRPMSTDPKNLEGTWDRLRWARTRWQTSKGIAPNAEAAAESLGMKAGTYRAYERRPGSSKHIALDHQSAPRLASKFGVNWIWLLTGDGSPDDMDQLTPNERRIIDAYREAPEGRQTAVADAITQLLKTG